MAHTWTWEKLANNSYRLNPKSRGPKYPYTPKWETIEFTSGQNKGQNVIVPYVGTKTLLISLRAWGVTQSALHAVTLLFHDVDIQTTNPNDRNYFQIQYNGQMYWIHKLDRRRNPLTARCSCFTGDTKVLLADGTVKTFKELEGQTNFQIVSYNEKVDKFEIVTAFNCEKKQENAEIIRVYLDNDTYIDCTPDHRFLTREGEWLRADSLTEGTSLRALYMDKHSMERILPNNKREKIKKHKAEKKFYVYIYLDPRYQGEYNYSFGKFDFKPIYIGKGCHNRDKSHLTSKATDRFHNTIRKLYETGIPPIIMRLKVGLQESVAYQTEKQWTEEVGLEVDGKGPLLNCKIGGEGGISSNSAIKTKLKNLENGSYEEHRKRMIEDNPMKREDVKQRSRETFLFNYTPDERSALAKKASDGMSKEQRIEIGKQCFEKGYKRKLEDGSAYQLTEQYREECREHMNKRIHDSEESLNEWKEFTSTVSKNNWNNPEIRDKMIEGKKKTFSEHMKNPEFAKRIKENCKKNGALGTQQRIENYKNNPQRLEDAKRKCNLTKATKAMVDVIKAYGYFDDSLYPKRDGLAGIEFLKRHGIYEIALKNALEQATVNHKVTRIEKQNNSDVYCLTAEYLGNFVIDCSDSDSINIFSGVTVANCKDFIFTWAWYNYYNAHCLYGPPPKPYKKKTNRKPRNPQGMPGICKHVYNVWAYLRNSGLTMN